MKSSTNPRFSSKKRGTVTVGVDKGCLRLQFPSDVSLKIWGKKQKYKTLGLSNTPQNKAVAEKLASIAQMDIFSDELDITLEKYNPHLLEKTQEKVQPAFPDLLSLYQKYLEEVIKPGTAPGTYRYYSTTYFTAIKLCGDADITRDSIKIRDAISDGRSPAMARKILDVLHRLTNWAIRNEIIPQESRNPYRAIKEDIIGKPKRKHPMLIEDTFGEKEEWNDCRAYSPEEALAIIEKIALKGYKKGLYGDLIKLLFLTGCRTGEAIGLTWKQINEDCSEINFCQSYCRVSRKTKSLKTARFDKTSRIFPCGEKLQALLLKLREDCEEPPKPNDFVFHRKGKPVSYGGLSNTWLGNATYKKKGVIQELMEEGKVKNYLKIYATRHSFITWQLKAGQTPANVAKLVGNTPAMIYQYYVSSDEDAVVSFEL